jgi:hypothetical protein
MRRLWFASGIVALAVASCTGKDPYNPGTPIGAFHIVGKLKAQNCGPAGSAPDPWEFDVKLSKDGSTLYWIQGGVPVSGTLDGNSHTTMTSSGTTTVHAIDAGPRCAIVRSDTLDLTLGPEPVTTAAGALSYAFAPTDDSDCTDQLADSGGGFSVLPCAVGYAITATKTDKTLTAPPPK